jgi:hypothetical protein
MVIEVGRGIGATIRSPRRRRCKVIVLVPKAWRLNHVALNGQSDADRGLAKLIGTYQSVDYDSAAVRVEVTAGVARAASALTQVTIWKRQAVVSVDHKGR